MKRIELETLNNYWTWDSIEIRLTNPEGKIVKLNSLKLNDNTLNFIGDDIEEYVKEQGGELE